MLFTRRRMLSVAAATLVSRGAWADPLQARRADVEAALAGLEPVGRGRLGVALVSADGRLIAGHRASERFALCSTAKALIVGATLAKVDVSGERLDRAVAVAPADLLSYAPVVKTRVGGEISVGELCAAAIEVSDNSAANLLVRALGGPKAVTAFARSLGDVDTRLDRIEPDLNQAEPGDNRDTTTPAAYSATLAKLACGDALAASSRDALSGWLVGCKTGTAKLRAGLPLGWRAGDKTGSGGHGANNDVAILWPPGRAPLAIACYLAETDLSDDAKNAVHAAVGRAIAAALGG